MAQPGSATVLGTVGREFESRRPDHFKSCLKLKIVARPVPHGRLVAGNDVNKKIFFFFKFFIDQRV